MKKIMLVVTMMYLATLQASASADPVACTREYAPVCATVQGQSMKQNFGNSCMAEAAHATHIVAGTCGAIQPVGSRKIYARAALQNGSWELHSFNGKMVEEGGTLSFEKNGKFHAKVCNVMNGRYGVALHRLNLRDTMSTMMYCQGDLMDIESAMSSERLHFSVTPDLLTIMTQKGDTIVWKQAELTK